ncbi:MAG: hypothetical protein AAGA55_02690 [Planctomycetota bacterium]
MPLPTDPMRKIRLHRRLIDLGTLAVVTAIGFAWVVGSREPPPLPAEPPAHPIAMVPTVQRDPFPSDAFAAILWYEPPPAPAQPPVRAVVVPDLSLLGIRRTDSGYAAVIRDGRTNSIVRVGEDDTVSGVRIRAVTPSVVRAEYEHESFELKLGGEEP